MSSHPDSNNLKMRLRACYLKATPGRIALLAVFDRAKKPITVAELINQLGAAINRATLYRNIEHLRVFGILNKINLGDKEQYYELASLAHHHHLTCRVCDKITDVEACNIPVHDQNLLQKSGFAEINYHSLEFFGICEKCSQGEGY